MAARVVQVLDTAVNGRVPKSAKGGNRSAVKGGGVPASRRDIGEDFAPPRRSLGPVGARIQEDEDFKPERGLRFRLRGGIPRSVIGKTLAGGVTLAALAGTIAAMWGLRTVVMASPRLVLESSAGVQILGNSHLTRAQLLTVFGEDVDRNILTVSLPERRAELERLPWVEHATVMRLLPNRFRVAIVERKPVAFVRHGNSIGLVDVHGVLLDMASDGDGAGASGEAAHYSFPVVTGLSADDPLSTRAARMKLYMRFMAELGEPGKTLSEVDLSNPEDVKALIPSGAADVLVHFGDKDFLHRYELFEKNLPGWLKEYPKLASADMRYERQVVLEMAPGSVVPTHDSVVDGNAPVIAAPKAASTKPVMKAKKKAGSTPPQTKKLSEMGHHKNVVGAKAAEPKHLTQAFDVKPKAVQQ